MNILKSLFRRSAGKKIEKQNNFSQEVQILGPENIIYVTMIELHPDKKFKLEKNEDGNLVLTLKNEKFCITHSGLDTDYVYRSGSGTWEKTTNFNNNRNTGTNKLPEIIFYTRSPGVYDPHFIKIHISDSSPARKSVLLNVAEKIVMATNRPVQTRELKL